MGDSDADSVVGAETLLGEGTNLEMAVWLGHAFDVTDGLRDLVPLVVAVGADHDSMTPAQVADATPAGARLGPDARKRVQAEAQRWEALATTTLGAEVLDEDVVSSLTLSEVSADPVGALAAIIDFPAVAAQLLPPFLNAGLTSLDEVLYFTAYLRAVRRPQRTPLLLRALFVVGLGTLEPTITRMVQLLLHRAEPQTYASRSDAGLSEDARKLTFGSPNVWRDALVRLGVTVVAAAVDWGRLGELWQDRNAIAHRGGVVDARHSVKSGAEVGSLVALSADDVAAALDLVGVARYAIIASVWNHLDPRIGHRVAAETWPRTVESLRAGRWRQAEGLARFEEALGADPEAVATAQVNRWLAQRQGLGPGAIREQVESWAPADLPQRFHMARSVLLGRVEEARRMLNELLADGSVTPGDLEDWPLFDLLRGSPLDHDPGAANMGNPAATDRGGH